MVFSADFALKERVRSAVDIVDVIGTQLELRRQGRNYVALCPWHDDRRPSMMVNQERQTWRCWVCDIGGDAFSYVMKRDGVSFPEALQILADRAGIAIEKGPHSKPVTPGSPEDKATLLSAMHWAVEQFYQCLEQAPEAEAARNYIVGRGIDDESRKRFRIGYAPESWDWLLGRARAAGFSGEVMQAAGLAVSRKTGSGHYDMFRDRVMFPIFDLQGRPVAVGGRILPGGEGKGGKYINGPETRLFSKSRQLYGLSLARDAIVRQKRVMVMEGYTDVIAARQAGIEPVVAVLGTALGESHIAILKRFAESVVLVLDGDTAGQKRADEVLEMFVGAEVDLRVLTLPDGQDPADFISREGREAFEHLVEAAPDAIDHKLQRLTAGVDLTHDTHRATAAAEAMLSILAATPVATSDLRLQQTLVRLGRTFMMPVEHLQKRLEELRRKRSRFLTSKHSKANAAADAPARLGASARSGASARLDGPDEWSGPSDVWIGADDAPRHDSAAPATPQPANEPLFGVDRELFETLIERPDLVGLAVEAIDERWLATHSARKLLKIYQMLELSGASLDVRDVILSADDEFLKNQLVILDERVQAKSEAAAQSAEERFDSILNCYRAIESKAENERRLAQLGQGSISEDEVTDLLREMFAAQQIRHGVAATLSAPSKLPPPQES